MLRSRSGRPSLIGRAASTAARTAVVVGTANAVSGRQARRQTGAAAAPVPAPAQADAAGPRALDDAGIAQLRQLAELHQAGILSDDEFANQKARLLG